MRLASDRTEVEYTPIDYLSYTILNEDCAGEQFPRNKHLRNTINQGTIWGPIAPTGVQLKANKVFTK